MSKREQILAALSAWIRQRPGLEYGNYGDVTAYRSEMRSITRDRHIAEKLLAAVSWRTSAIDENALREAFRAYSGRLTLVDRADGSVALEYCTGQYWPTEYRKAVCAVLAAALWDSFASDLKPDLPHPGNFMREYFKREFGHNIARRYFN